MKNNIKRIFIVITLLFISIFCLSNINNVKADSGWDSSYDSGSSSDSSSSWHSKSNMSRRELTPEELAYIEKESEIVTSFILFICVVLLIILIPKYRKIKKEINLIRKKRDEELKYKINSIMPNLNRLETEKLAYQIFYEVQIAWMKFDYEKLKDLLSDELYNSYVMDLEALKLKNQKNVMKDFDLVYTNLIDLKEQNNKYIAKIELEVKFIDYIEDNNTHKVLRGNHKHKLDNTYVLTFVRSKSEREEIICPSCGAPVEGNAAGKCEYCKSKIVNNNYSWVLSKKEKISQK